MEKFTVFVCSNSEKSCARCRSYNGKVYWENDKRRPRLPLHRNCRCYYKKYTGSLWDKEALIQFVKNLPEATIIALETALLPAAFGEFAGAVKAATLIYTDYSFWALQARNAAIKNNSLDNAELAYVLLEIDDALARKDIKTIIRIYNKYK